jgi:hypothetical protein
LYYILLNNNSNNNKIAAVASKQQVREQTNKQASKQTSCSNIIKINDTTCIKSATLKTWQHASATTSHHQV